MMYNRIRFRCEPHAVVRLIKGWWKLDSKAHNGGKKELNHVVLLLQIVPFFIRRRERELECCYGQPQRAIKIVVNDMVPLNARCDKFTANHFSHWFGEFRFKLLSISIWPFPLCRWCFTELSAVCNLSFGAFIVDWFLYDFTCHERLFFNSFEGRHSGQSYIWRNTNVITTCMIDRGFPSRRKGDQIRFTFRHLTQNNTCPLCNNERNFFCSDMGYEISQSTANNAQ